MQSLTCYILLIMSVAHDVSYWRARLANSLRTRRPQLPLNANIALLNVTEE